MIIILKTILSLFIVMCFFIGKVLYKDFKLTQESEQFDEMPSFDKLKISFIFYFILFVITSFCCLMGYYIIIPLTIIS